MGESRRNRKSPRARNISRSKSLLTTAIVVICVIAIVSYDFYQRSQHSPLKIYSENRIKGDMDAPLHILEFIDFQCSECARGSRILKSYMSKYPYEMLLTIKYSPLGELNSNISAAYAECAARQDFFWEFHDLLFKRQSYWRLLKKINPFFITLAKEVGLDVGELQECLKRQETYSVIEKEKALGEAHFVKSTPTYFINDEMVVGVESLKQTLEEYFENNFYE